jgi:hypothetical protein
MVQVKPLPEGMGTAPPQTRCGGAANAIALYKGPLTLSTPKPPSTRRRP